MTTKATGTFVVTPMPHPPYDTAPGATLSRMTFTKKFSGDLEADSHVEMLSAMSEIKGSAGYVAQERVNGSVHGKRGSFVLQHTGIMNRGMPSLVVTVVPDSGSGDLKTLSGTMTIDIVDKEHRYTFDYAL